MAGDLKLTVDISALTKAQQMVAKLDGQIINLKFNTTGLESLKMMNQGFTSSSKGTKTLIADVNNLGNAIKKVTTTDEFGKPTKEVTTYRNALGQTTDEIKKYKDGVAQLTGTQIKQQDTAKQELANLGKQKTLYNEINKIQTQGLSRYANKGALSGLGSELQSLDVKSSDFENKYTKIKQSVVGFKTEAQGAKYAQDQLTQANKKNLLSVDNIKESMGTAAVRTVEWAVSMGVLYGAANAVTSMVKTSVAISDQMNNIKMVTGSSDSEIKSMLGTYQTLATDLSSTTSQVAASAEVWVRQGRSISDTNDLIKTSTVLSKVGFMDSATSAQLLTSSINGYGIAAKDAMSVVDKMSAIDVNAATSTEDLAVAMAQTASGAKIAGVSMDELLSYIATISDVTQASGDTIGVSLKTVFARINSVKLGSLTDGEGEDISRVETVLKQYGITLRDTNGTARETGDILDELSTKWGSLTGLEKSEIAMQMAGVHQKEKFLVLMENYDKALKYQEISTNSAGSAMQKMSVWEQSTEAATQRLSNQWEILSTNIVDSNFIKSIVNLGTLSLTGLNTGLGQMIIKAGMLAAFVSALSFAKGKVSKGWGAIDIIDDSGIISGIKKIAEAQKAYKALDSTADAAKTTIKTASKATEEAGDVIKTVGNVTEGVGDTVEGLGDVTSKFGKNTFSSKVATEGLGSALKGVAVAAAPFVLAFAAVAGGIAIADAITVSYGEHMKNIDNYKTNLSDNKAQIDSISSSLEENIARIKEIKATGSVSLTDQQEITRLEITNQQLQTRKQALEEINKVTTKKLSDEAIDTMNSRTVSSTYDPAGTDKLGVSAPIRISTIDSLKEQMEQVKDVENQIFELQANRDPKKNEQYLAEYDKLSAKQKEYSQKASETALTLNTLADSIDGTTTNGKAQLAVIDDLNKQLLENNKLVDGYVDPSSTKTNAEIKSQFNGASAQNFSDMGKYITTVENGLASGLTENAEYKTSLMTLFSDINPPTDVEAGLESLKMLFSESDEYAGQFLDTVNGFKFDSGNFDLKGLQQAFNLSDTAIATVNSRLEEMGLIMSTSAADGVWNLGNGLGLVSDQSTEFEMQLNKMLKPVKDGGSTFQEAESYIRDYLGTLGVTGGKIEQVVSDFSMLKQGANDGNLLAFTGLTGEGELSGITEQAGTLAKNYTTTFKDYFQSEMSKGTKIEDIKMDLGFGVSTDQLKENIAQALTATGLFAEDQVQQMAEMISNNTVNANFSIVAEGVVSQLNIQDEGVREQVKTIIQSHFNADTQTFDIPAITGEIKKISVEGVNSEELAAQVEQTLTPIKVNIDATTSEVATKDAAEITKPEEKKIVFTADAAQARSELSMVQGQLNSLQDKRVKFTVEYVAAGSAQAMADSGGGGSTASTDVFTGGNHGSATGRININTAQFGTESLIGEEGEETLIRNGKVSFIGTNGADIIPVRDGDTILPADVTKKIKSGQIPMYAEGKYAVSFMGLSSASSVANYRDSGNYNGLGDDAPEDEEAKKAYDAHKKAFDKEIAYAKHLRDMDEIDEAEYYRQLDSINERYFANRSDFLDEYRDHEAEVYEFLKKKEKERLDDLKESYSSSSDYVLDMLDKQIDKLKEEEDLKDKQEKVDNLKANKNQRVYYEGSGWTWEADKTAIAEAEKDVKDDSASAKLKKYRDKWAEISDNYENEQNKIEAIAQLGDGFEDKILSGDLSILRDFATKYSSVLGQVDNNDGDTTIPLIDYANAWAENKSTLESKESNSILTSALSNSLIRGAQLLSTSETSTDFNPSIIFSGDINLENVTDFESFITEAKQYAKVNSPKQ